jgi:tight adherence protein B
VSVDARWVFLILIFAAVFTAGQAVFGLTATAVVKRKVNRRLKVAERVDGVEGLVMELRKQRGLNAAGETSSRLAWLSELIAASGVPYDRRRWTMICVAAGLLGGLLPSLLLRSPLLFPIGAGAFGIGAPVAYLKMMAGKRSKALGYQLPQALEIIVRSLEAGHPVPTAVALVGREMPDPVGTEFGMAADEIAYGANLAEAVERISARCRHPDIDLFAATIRLQERSGGNLTGLLKLNAHTVRERHKMRLKIKAASSEGRASAMILSGAPFVTLGIIMISSPHFYGDVIHERVIQSGLSGLGVWMLIGNLVMRRMIDMRI